MELWTAFLLGLAGSLHCAGMCCPLVLAVAKTRPRTARESAGRVFCHIGRVASYCLFGLMLGYLGHAAAPAGFQRWLSIALGIALLGGLLLPAKVPLAAPVWKRVAWLKSSIRGLLQRMDQRERRAKSLGQLAGQRQRLPGGVREVCRDNDALQPKRGWTGPRRGTRIYRSR